MFYFLINNTPDAALLNFYHHLLTGIIGGTVSFLLLYTFFYLFFLKRRGSSFNRLLKEQFSLAREEVKKQIESIRDDIAPPGEIIQGLIDNMRDKKHDDIKLHTFYGLKENLSDEEVFQDFKSNATNVNCIHYLWLDAFSESTISAFVDTNSDYPFLSINFNHRSTLSQPNVAIRSQNDKALDNSTKRIYLSFDAKMNPKSQNKILLAVRVVNGWLQHWQYATRPNEYILIPIENEDWKRFSIELHKPDKWSLFESDGNNLYSPSEPDFRIITDVIFEVGAFTGIAGLKAGRPAQGEGIVDIRDIGLERDARGTVF